MKDRSSVLPMPVAGAHDESELRRILSPWLAERAGADDGVEISEFSVPQSNGFSNETFLLKASWQTDGEPHDADLVLRSQAPEHQVFPVVDLINQQYTTMDLLGRHTAIPVPAVRWSESDPAVLGQAFFLMDRLYGDVPGDNPPFMRDSFVTEWDVPTRRQWHENSLDTMIAVGEVDWQAIGIDYLDLDQFGALGPAQRQGYMRHFHQWTLEGGAHPVADPAWAWLEANWPDDGEHLELCWGDARPGNQMCSGTEIVGVFDWEGVCISNAESDLGWWLFLQQFSSVGMGVELPDGMLTRAETIARWESRRERPAANVEFYERLAAFQFSLIMVRLSRALQLGMEVDNPVTPLARQLFGL